MRKNLNSSVFIYPMPVLIVASYDDNEIANAMNAGWGAVSGRNEIFLSLSPKHKTVKNIISKKDFTVSIGEYEYVKSCDYVGMVSGNKVPDKLENTGFTTTKSELIDAPIINELSICLECRLKQYDFETEHLIAEVVNISIDEKILTNGKIDLQKINLLCLDAYNKTYCLMGKVVGHAFKDGQEIINRVV